MTRPYRIAHLLASNFFGGPEKQLVEHATRIGACNFEPHIISFIDSGASNELLERAGQRGIATTAIHGSGPLDPRQVGIVSRLLRSERIDLLCAHGYKANVIGRLASWLTGIPLVVISRGWTGEDRKIRCYEWLDRAFLRVANHIVAVSVKQCERVARLGIPERKLSVIHNCIAVNRGDVPRIGIRGELGLPDSALLAVSAGRLSPEKNYGGMIDAAKTVCERNSDVYFAVFGEGRLRAELEQQVVAQGLAGRFLLPGFRTDLQALLREVDIFVLPSFTEGLPNVVLEAYAAGKPVVATAVGGTPEVVQDLVTGFLTDPQEPQYMAQCLLQLAEDPELRKTMGASGYRRVLDCFTFERQTEQYRELYLRLLKRRENSSGGNAR